MPCILEWGGWQARTRDENFVRGGGAAAGVLSSVCVSSTQTLLFDENPKIFAPRRSSFPATGAPFGVFCTNGSVVEQFCNRCAHRFSRFYANATFRARLAVPRKRNFACSLRPKVLKRGAPSWRAAQARDFNCWSGEASSTPTGMVVSKQGYPWKSFGRNFCNFCNLCNLCHRLQG